MQKKNCLENSPEHLLKKQTPQLSYFSQLCYFEITQDICYIKQTPSYFKLSYLFWEHKDSLGQGTTVNGTLHDNFFTITVFNTYC